MAAAGKALEQIDIAEIMAGVHPRIGAWMWYPSSPWATPSWTSGPGRPPFRPRSRHCFGVRSSFTARRPCTPSGGTCPPSPGRPGRAPDKDGKRGMATGCGTAVCSDKGGATAVGGRMPLIAFNIELRSSDLGLARRIAPPSGRPTAACPASRPWVAPCDPGHRPGVHDLTDYRHTPIRTVFDRCRPRPGRGRRGAGIGADRPGPRCGPRRGHGPPLPTEGLLRPADHREPPVTALPDGD